MKIDYDPQADAIYICLRDSEIADTVQISKYIFADVDEEGIPIGIEILFASRHLAQQDLTSFTVNIQQMAQPMIPLPVA